jgi:hypothetical protein
MSVEESLARRLARDREGEGRLGPVKFEVRVAGLDGGCGVFFIREDLLRDAISLGGLVLDEDMETGVYSWSIAVQFAKVRLGRLTCLEFDEESEVFNVGSVGGATLADEVQVGLDGALGLVHLGHTVALAIINCIGRSERRAQQGAKNGKTGFHREDRVS